MAPLTWRFFVLFKHKKMARLNIESGEMKMGFCEMMELLQKRESGKIIFCNMGNFYIAIGKDAVLLNNLLGLNKC